MSDFANFSNFNDIDLSSPTGSSQPASSNDFDDFVGGRAAKQTFNTGPFNSNGSYGGSNGGKGFGGVSVGGGKNSNSSSKVSKVENATSTKNPTLTEPV